VQYWADLQTMHGLRCYDNIARREREMSTSALYSLYAWFVSVSVASIPSCVLHIQQNSNNLLLFDIPCLILLQANRDPSVNFEIRLLFEEQR